MVKRVFEIELNVPDDFGSEYGPFYTLTPHTVINNGDLAWTIYSDKVKPEPQWVKAKAKDEGRQVRFQDREGFEWSIGKLLHVMPPGSPFPFLVLDSNNNLAYYKTCEVQL